MKTTLSLAALAAILGLGAPARADHHTGGQPDAKAMQAMQAAMTPGEQHKKLARHAGKWNAVVKFTMGPGGEARESKGTSEMTMVLGGRWLKQDFTGSAMGQPFTGTGYTGYDNFKKQFVSLWMDSMSTSAMVSYGTADKDGKTVTYTTVMDEPMTGERDKKVKTVMRVIDDNKMVFEMWDKAQGKEWKALEITYTRAK